MEILTQLLWGRILPVLLILTALVCLVRLRGRPVRGLHSVLRDTYGSLLRKPDAAQRRIFASALAATMGTGNLAGTALALKAGGPGAVFWMWISALLGTELVSAENLLSDRYRSENRNGTVIGGLGSLTGSVLGAILVTLLPEFFRSLSNYRMLIYGVAVVLIIMFRPNGLYGYKEFSLKRLINRFKGKGKASPGKEAA